MSPRAGRTLFASAALITFAIGAAWMLAPAFMYAQWAVDAPSPAAVYMARRYATMFFGYSVLLWFARDAATTQAGRAIAAGGTVVSTAMAIVSAWGAVSGVVGPLIWPAAVIEAALAVGFVRLWRRP